ncbi:MAG: YdcF family protein [Anaerolineaceae bacterium]|nr:YdcF family protein [Anaerolineaceae bacterium]
MLKEKGFTRVLLVTSAMHMPRSVALFKHDGIEVIPAPTDYTVTESGMENLQSLTLESFFINLMPNTSSLSLTTNVMKEYIGLLIYVIRGWL